MTCTVIGFPLGQNTTATKVAETEDAYAMGCDEFDMVINVGKLKDGDTAYVKNEIAAVVAAAKGRTVKVIIETGLLTDEEKATATRLTCEAGAHFGKTCTGVSAGVATVADVTLMKENLSGNTVIKASAGIRTYEDTMALIEAGASRIGTSAGIAIVTDAKN
jgi:deoxyribose-phosphate aldolase